MSMPITASAPAREAAFPHPPRRPPPRAPRSASAGARAAAHESADACAVTAIGEGLYRTVTAVPDTDTISIEPESPAVMFS